jgi:serine/threonine protein kinase
MDFIPFKSLRDYLKFNRESMSLITKIYLIFSITQSLRYIRDFRIVHLDLKPNNIMIFCNLLIKLIDFGESYHP